MDLLIVGASARAAAFSALRAGLTPGAIDLFADRDLALVARSVRIPPADYPAGLIDAADDFPACPWVYTGAIENRPDVVERLAARRPLWGNTPATLLQVRDPIRVSEVLHDAGLPAPEVRLSPDGLPHNGSWLRKPVASGGGFGITPFRGAVGPEPRGRVYYQARARGLPTSAVFVARASGVELAGVTLQFVGATNAAFAYRGSLAPFPLPEATLEKVAAIGSALGAAFGLVGLFGVDLVLDGDTPWPVEVNPRYTASVEVLELATGRSLLAEHCAACGGGLPRFLPQPDEFARGCVAKEVLYAPKDCVVPYDAIDFARHEPARYEVPDLADLPDAGARFRAGDPVLTVFARGPGVDETLKALGSARRLWARHLLRPLDPDDDQPDPPR